MARRNRIIYPSNSVWANGNVLYRVMTFGSTTTFNTEDIFELGQLKVIDVVDDSPTVAVTIETDEFGALSNLYHLANLEFDNVVVPGLSVVDLDPAAGFAHSSADHQPFALQVEVIQGQDVGRQRTSHWFCSAQTS